jgi:urease accessory protein
MTMRKTGFATALLAAALIPAGSALAHTGTPDGAGLMAGVAHPLTGYDHMIAMAAVGLWAWRQGGRAMWLLPLVFLAAMALGMLVGLSSGASLIAEIGVGASLLVFVLMAWRRQPIPLYAASALVAGFALFHGHAHGAIVMAGDSVLPFIVGALIGTGMAHALGMTVGAIFQRRPDQARSIR